MYENIIKEVRKNLNKKQYQSGTIREMAICLNTFEQRTDELIRKVSESGIGRNHMIRLAIGCALYLGYKWKKDEQQTEHYYVPHYDRRVYASSRFCYLHMHELSELYQKYENVDFAFHDPIRAEEDFLKNLNVPYGTRFYFELLDFQNVHPTIQQKMMRFFCEFLNTHHVLEADKKEISFPLY